MSMPSDTANAGKAALTRLLKVAMEHSGQSRMVADFLLAWWNAPTCGKWDPTDMWGVDDQISRDMLTVLAMINASREYPDAAAIDGGDAFRYLEERWRPALVEREAIDSEDEQ